MTLLITVFAAILVSIRWYRDDTARKLEFGFLSLMLWGASLMWLCDAVTEYLELGAEYFTPALEDMINDAFLGFAAVALGLIIWLVILLIHDPKGVIKNSAAKQISTRA